MAHNRAQGSKTQGDKHKAQTTNKEQTGKWPSENENKTQNEDVKNNNVQSPGVRTDERSFDILIDGVPYLIRSVPFLYNDELRFRVTVNNDTEHIFTWDSEVSMLRAIDDDASTLPDRLEEAISDKLQSHTK